MHPKHHGYGQKLKDKEEAAASEHHSHHPHKQDEHHHHHAPLYPPPLPYPPIPPPLLYPPPPPYPPIPPPFLPLPIDSPPPHPHLLPPGKLYRVFCKSHKNYNLAVHEGKLLVVRADTEKESQQWIKDETFGIRVRDLYGHPAFMLVNKGSKKVLKHTKDKVHLVDYKASMNFEDEELLWTESQDFGEGFKTIRKANDTLLNLSVLHVDEHESTLTLDTWHKKDNQLWKMFPL